MHNELPIEIPGNNDAGRKTDKSKEKKDNISPSHGSSPGHAKNSIELDTLQEDDNNDDINDNNPDNRLPAQTNNDSVNTNEDTSAESISSAGMKENSQSQQEQLKTKLGDVTTEILGMEQSKTAQHKGSENDNVSASPKRERKVKPKTHHIEVPFEDYPSSDSLTSQTNTKIKSQDIQGHKPNDNCQRIINATKNENSAPTGGSKSTSLPKISDVDKQKETSSSVNNLSHATDSLSHQRTKTEADSTVNDIKQKSSNQTGAHKSRFIEKDEILPSSSETAGSSPAHARKQSPIKHQNNLQSPQMGKASTSTNSASPPAVRKATEQENHAPKLKNSAQMDSSQKSSCVSTSNMLDSHKLNATNPDHNQEPVQEKSSKSPLNNSDKMVSHKNNLRHDQQNTTASPKHRKQNPESPGGSPTHAQKMQSPERTQKNRKINAASNSPPINRRAGGSSSPPRHLQKRRDHLSKEEKTQEQSILIQSFSSSGRKEEIQKKKIIHPSPSSQSSDFPSSFSSSPPKQQQRSPNKSPKLPGNGDRTSRTRAFHSNPRNEEFSNTQSRQSSPSSQSSDGPSSPSSSLKKIRPKSPELATKIQGHKDIPATNVASSSNIKTDDLHTRHGQPSSSVNVTSPDSSPLSAKELLHYRKKEANQKDPNKSIAQQRTHK
ncbi:uncharacterized protein [Ranitomeya imitator]|uniref:uncharacterized protein n=1 Tax=Ranitomeya imitator TaxID=111125 RepID=UPI0037E87437